MTPIDPLGASEAPTAPREPTTADPPTKADGSPPGPTERRLPAIRLSDAEVLARLQARDRIGRFAFIRNLGEGGMGIVSLAYDEELDRRVAIKVIRSRYCDNPEIRRRFVREAQALARLSHPNIVTIYEVGEHAGRPFLAMEMIDGCDLRAWLRREKRQQRAILRLLVDVGRGLAAAHAAGIIHRDFKPANVLVGDDGRGRVVDFGLARAAGEPDDRSPGEAPSPLGEALTHVGSIIGTPAYMAPEQLLGAPVDARTDQYAFAIATYEALVGERPFRGTTVAARRDEGFEPPPMTSPRLPWKIARALRRALDVVPDRRFPSMEALLAELAEPPRWPWLAAGGAALVVAITVAITRSWATAEPCTDAGERLADVWSPATEATIRAAIGAREGVDQPALDLLLGLLRGFAERWTDTQRDACLAHHRGESSAATHDARIRCLDRGRVAFTALVELLSAGEADPEEAIRDINAIRVSQCRSLDAASEAERRPAPAIADEIDALEHALARASTSAPTRLDAALAEVEAIRARAHELAYRPLVARALRTSADLLLTRGDFEEACRRLEEAFWITVAIDEPELSAEIIGSLMYNLDEKLGRPLEAARWERHADALIERIGRGSAAEARISGVRGVLALRRDELDVALTQLQRTLALTEALDDRPSLALGIHAGNLGAALVLADRHREAMKAFSRARSIFAAELGPYHVNTLKADINIAHCHATEKSFAAALRLLDEALARTERHHAGRPFHAFALQSRGRVRYLAGAHVAARADLQRALEIGRASVGASPDTRRTLHYLVDVDQALADAESALGHAEAMVEMNASLFDPGAAKALDDLGRLLEILRARGEIARVRRLAEAALAGPLEPAASRSPESIAYIRYHLAWALREQGADPRRVLGEVEAALAVIRAADPADWEVELRELTAWAAAPRRRRPR